MLQVDMTASVRQNFGKGAARSLRRSGLTPAILYGAKADPMPLSLDTAVFTKALMKIHGQNAVVTLDIEGDKSKNKHLVMLKEVQKDPVQDTLIHADFYEVKMDEFLTLVVPINFVGKAKGVDLGGVLNISRSGVHIKGLPLDIPDSLEVDITDLELGGKGLTCGELPIPANVTMLEEEDTVFVSVIHLKREVTAEEGAEEGEGAAAEAGAADAAPAAEAEAAGKSAD